MAKFTSLLIMFLVFTFTAFAMKADMTSRISTPAPNGESAMSSNVNYRDDMPDLQEIMSKCNESFRIEMSYWNSMNESGSFPDETDKTPKCYVRCVLEATGVASEDSQFDPAMAAAVFAGARGGKPMGDVEEMARECVEQTDTCKCERAYGFMKCLMEKEIDKYENVQLQEN